MLPKEAIIEVVRADYLGGYRLCIEFSDGHKQEVDFEPFLRRSAHPEISKYLDPNLFKQFRIVDGQLDWNDYDLCFPLEDLYDGAISSLAVMHSSPFVQLGQNVGQVSKA
ncbi:MAG: DUF2442 domain-containing protein [Syntrophales bacterium]|nr:DUF2442 domain-containing protein [Syntrophales bacterium]